MKKSLFILIFLLLTFSSFAQYSGGNGTLSNPYKIKYVKDFIALSNNVIGGNYYLGQYFIMVNDIDFVNGSIDSSQYFAPIGGWSSLTTNSPANLFKGNFDGDGYIVKNLTLNKPSNSFVSLFGYIENATIKNIGIINGYFVGTVYSGGLVANAINSSIQNSFAKSYVSVTSSNTAVSCGGLVGFLDNSIVNNCYAFPNINVTVQNGNIGGLVGNASYNSSIISNSYSVPINFSAPSNTKEGLFCGYLYNGATISNSYYSSAISGYSGLGAYYASTSNLFAKTDVQLKDSLIISSLNNSQTTSPWSKDLGSVINNGFPILSWQKNLLKVFVQSVGQDSIRLNAVYNDTSSIVSRGIKYKQASLNIWNFLNVLDTNFNYTLNNLIPNSEYNIKAFVVIGTDTIFSNIVTAKTLWQGDGTQNNPFIINNVYDLISVSRNVMNGITYSGQYLKMNNDIDFVSSTIDSSQFFTPIGGWSSISQTDGFYYFKGNFDGNGYRIFNLTVNKPNYSFVAVFGTTKDATISNLGVVGGNFTGVTNVSGLVGSIYTTTINNCYSRSIINSAYDHQEANAGGLVGYSYSNSIINGCYTEGIITASGIASNVGGLIGFSSESTINNSYAKVGFNVSGNSSYVGGLIGKNYAASVYNSYSIPLSFNTPSYYSVNNSLFIGNVTNGGAIVNNYYSDSLSGYPNVSFGSTNGIYSKTPSQLKHVNIVSIPSSLGNSLNFGSVSPCPWTIDTLTNLNNGYPVQNWQYFYPAKPIVDSIVVYSDSASICAHLSLGTYPIITKGIEWKQIDSISWNIINLPLNNYSTTITNLIPNTNYQVRAFAITENATYYDTIRIFTTLYAPIVLGEVITQGVTNMNDTSVTLNGTLVSLGNALSNIKIGFAYSSNFDSNFGVDNVDTVQIQYYEGITTFSKLITNLIPQTYYYYRAFIINEAGINYGEIGGFWFDRLGLSNIENNTIFVQIYPNPANDKVKLEIKGLTKNADIIFYDINGRKVKQYNLNAGQKELEINVNDLAKGVYEIKIVSDKDIVVKKLIVN